MGRSNSHESTRVLQVGHTNGLSNRLDFVDGLRGFAAVCVVIAHACGELWPDFYTFQFTVFEPGSFGVNIFFLCSGFVIPLSLERNGSLKRFWIQRFFRLYPLYWLSIALVLLFSYMGLAVGEPGLDGAQPWTLLANVTMMQMFLGFPHMLGVYWTLTFEMLYYVLISVIFVLGLRKRSVAIAISFILATIMVEGLLPALMHVQVPVGIMNCLATILVGTVMYRIHMRQVTRLVGALAIGLAALMILIVMLLMPAMKGEVTTYFYLLTSTSAAYAVFGLAFAFRNRSVPRWLLFLGQISYSLYLLHLFVIRGIPASENELVTLLVWSAVTLLVSASTYRLVEEPFMRLGRRLADQHRVGAGRQVTAAKAYGDAV